MQPKTRSTAYDQDTDRALQAKSIGSKKRASWTDAGKAMIRCWIGDHDKRGTPSMHAKAALVRGWQRFLRTNVHH